MPRLHRPKTARDEAAVRTLAREDHARAATRASDGARGLPAAAVRGMHLHVADGLQRVRELWPGSGRRVCMRQSVRTRGDAGVVRDHRHGHGGHRRQLLLRTSRDAGAGRRRRRDLAREQGAAECVGARAAPPRRTTAHAHQRRIELGRPRACWHRRRAPPRPRVRGRSQEAGRARLRARARAPPRPRRRPSRRERSRPGRSSPSPRQSRAAAAAPGTRHSLRRLLSQRHAPAAPPRSRRRACRRNCRAVALVGAIASAAGRPRGKQ